MSTLDLPGVRELLLAVSVPVQLVSEANAREHWSSRARRAARQREATTASLWRHPGRLAGPALLAAHGRLEVTLVRRGARLLDDDNLAGSCKHVRDAVAAWLGCDDGPRGPCAWVYGQQAHRRWRHTPEVLIELRPAAIGGRRG